MGLFYGAFDAELLCARHKPPAYSFPDATLLQADANYNGRNGRRATTALAGDGAWILLLFSFDFISYFITVLQHTQYVPIILNWVSWLSYNAAANYKREYDNWVWLFHIDASRCKMNLFLSQWKRHTLADASQPRQLHVLQPLKYRTYLFFSLPEFSRLSPHASIIIFIDCVRKKLLHQFSLFY